MGATSGEPTAPSRGLLLAALLLVAAPYLLNDLGNIFLHTPGAWLACDYGSRALSLLTLVWLVRCGALARSDLALNFREWWRFPIAVIAATAIAAVLLTGGAAQFFRQFTALKVGWIPDITPPGLQRFDYFAGLSLVGLSEELVFRAALPRLIERAGGSSAVALAVSTVMFGLAHWSLGVGSMMQTALVGLVFAACVKFSRSLWPAIIAHAIADMIAFA
jgi:membrane protease YdiL (CAAX protease family)